MYPAASDIETMYPMIDPRADSPRYNSPQMATVDIADDRAALASIYPAAGYAASTGTLRGRVVAKDGTSQLTGVNVIARRVDQGRPFDAMSRISGDLTQGLLGADGDFVMTGLVPGASYVVHIDEIGRGGFSTPKAMLLGPEEYWNAGESGDASVDDACASTPITVAAGEVRQIRIAVNGIPRAPTFTHIPYVLVSNLSDNGQQLVGVYGTFQSPFWTWDKTNGQSYLGGSGFLGAISGNGRVVGGTVGVPVMMDWGPMDQERAALWTKSGGWKSIAGNYEGCGGSQTTPYDLSTDGSTAVGLAFVDCRNAYAFKWTARTGMKLLPKVSENAQCQDPWSGDIYECEGAARANAVSANGSLVGGWEEIPEAGGNRIGSIWQGNEQMLLRDPGGDNAMGGWVGEVMGVNSAGTIAVGVNAGEQLKDAYQWTSSRGVTSLGRYPVTICYFDWWTWQDVCDDPETAGILRLGRRQGDHRSRPTAGGRHRRGCDLHAEDGLDAHGRVPAATGRARGIALADPRRERLGPGQDAGRYCVAAGGRLLPGLPPRTRPGVRLPRQGQRREHASCRVSGLHGPAPVAR